MFEWMKIIGINSQRFSIFSSFYFRGNNELRRVFLAIEAFKFRGDFRF